MALVADADAYTYTELAGAPILARGAAALLAASDAISRVLLARRFR